MKSIPILLAISVLLLIASANADIIAVNYEPYPFPGYNGPFPNMVVSPSQLQGFFIDSELTVTNVTPGQVVYLSAIDIPELGGSVCFPLQPPPEVNLCNAAGELSLAGNRAIAFWPPYDFANLPVFGKPGVYTFSANIYGGFTGINDHMLLGTDSFTVTVTPEPTTLVLLGTGLLGLIGVARRKLSD